MNAVLPSEPYDTPRCGRHDEVRSERHAEGIRDGSVENVGFAWCDSRMSENTNDLAAALATLLAAVGQTQTAAPAAPQTMLTVAETAEMLRCSESLIYAQLKDGRLRGVMVGRRRLVPATEINRIIESGGAAA